MCLMSLYHVNQVVNIPILIHFQLPKYINKLKINRIRCLTIRFLLSSSSFLIIFTVLIYSTVCTLYVQKKFSHKLQLNLGLYVDMMWLLKKFQTLESQYNDPQIYKTTYVFGKKSILNFAHFSPGPPNLSSWIILKSYGWVIIFFMNNIQ